MRLLHSPLAPLILISFGFLALYLPSYIELARTTWQDSDEMHGPIVLIVAAWSLFQLRHELIQSHVAKPVWWGWAALALGLVFFIVGKLLSITVMHVGSQVIVLGALALIIGGFKTLRLMLFPLVFLIFMVPLPGNLIDSITGSLKEVVSVFAEQLLYWAGYPIARSGVTLTVGQYQLLVADACSGLKSMFSLSAVGMLYIYLIQHKSPARNILLAASLLPIAFVANIIRVIVLILVTYHFGDEAGQGFVHDFAGMVLFILAVLMLVTFDAFLGLVFKRFLK